MKKILTIITAIFALTVGALAIQAAPAKHKVKSYKKAQKKVYKVKYNRLPNDGLYNGHYNRRGVYIFYTKQIVSTWRGKFKNTYKHRVFPNGRHKVKLIKSVKIYHAYPVRVRFKTKTKYRNGRKIRVTYKIIKYSDGTVKRIPIRRKRAW